MNEKEGKPTEQKQGEGDGFHVHDGLYFNKINDTHIGVTMRKDAKENSPIIVKILMTRDDWESVIYAMQLLPLEVKAKYSNRPKEIREGDIE